MRAIREKARRLYAQCLGRDRDTLAIRMERFEGACKNAGLSQRKREVQHMHALLEEMEKRISGYGMLPSDFEAEDGSVPLQ